MGAGAQLTGELRASGLDALRETLTAAPPAERFDPAEWGSFIQALIDVGRPVSGAPDRLRYDLTTVAGENVLNGQPVESLFGDLFAR